MSAARNSTVKPVSVYKALHRAFGPQGWWPLYERKRERTKERPNEPKYHPGKFPPITPAQAFEIAVGAILTQNTAWTNVVKALQELRRAKALSPEKIVAMPSARLAQLIRSSGYFTQKAKKLKVLAQFFRKRPWREMSMLSNIREKLLSLWGVGPETADSILLYALNKPVFVVDAYTRRIGERLGWGPWTKPSVPYDTVRQFFETQLPQSVPLYQEFHALLVKLAKKYCTKNKPLCALCPIHSKCFYANERLQKLSKASIPGKPSVPWQRSAQS